MNRSTDGDPTRRQPVDPTWRRTWTRTSTNPRSETGSRSGPQYLGEPRRRSHRAELEHCFASVLDGLTFPAQRWQILATAEYYGADGDTLRLLHSLRATQYRTFADVTDDIATSADVRDRLAGR